MLAIAMSQLLTQHLKLVSSGELQVRASSSPPPPLPLACLPFRYHIYLWNGIFFSLAFDSHQINYLKFGGERVHCPPHVTQAEEAMTWRILSQLSFSHIRC